MSDRIAWDWVARPEHYVPKKTADDFMLHGILFPYEIWADGPPGWPCNNEVGVTANPGKTWLVCKGCGASFGRVPRGGDGRHIDAMERERLTAAESHKRNCGSWR